MSDTEFTPAPTDTGELQPHYHVVNMVRSPATRTVRAAAPIHHRRTQHILDTQQRLIPNRPILISKADLLRNRDELINLEAQGIAEVREIGGRKLDLASLAVKAAIPTPPARTPRDNSIAADAPKGEAFFPAPGQPGSDLLVAKQEAKRAAQEDPTVVTEAVETTLAPVMETVAEDEFANAFGGPSTEEEEVEEPAADSSDEETEITDAPQPKRRGRPRKG